jgi:hypothetical protein
VRFLAGLTKPCCIVVSAAIVCKKYSVKSKLALFNIDRKTGKRVLKNQRQPWWKPEIRKKGRIALVRVHDEKSRSFTCLQKSVGRFPTRKMLFVSRLMAKRSLSRNM